MEQTQSRFKAFLARKNVNITVKTYLIDAVKLCHNSFLCL